MSNVLSKFLDPKNDFAFKRIFASERNKDILIHFLNDIFGRTTDPIEEVTFLKAAQEPEILSQRVSLVDILCKDTDGNRFIVEMQVAHRAGFEKRAQYYAAKAYIEQRERGADYHDLKQVTLLSILDFILFPDKPAYLSHHIFLDKDTFTHDLKDFSFSFLELPKFKKQKNELITMTEKWAFFFKHAEETLESEVLQVVGNDLILERAYEELDRFSWTPEELRAYDAIEMKTLDDKARFKNAEEKGELRGKRTIVRILLSNGMDINQIMRFTNLSQAEILILVQEEVDS